MRGGGEWGGDGDSDNSGGIEIVSGRAAVEWEDEGKWEGEGREPESNLLLASKLG